MEEDWIESEELKSRQYTCGYCGFEIASNYGYTFSRELDPRGPSQFIYICHYCQSPTFFDRSNSQYPGEKYGNKILGLSQDVQELYDEARNCFTVNAYTSTVLCCRKLLMNIAFNKGASEGNSFEFYVNYLNDNGYIPPDGKQWVDRIRKLGNKATHKIELKNREDAELALNFTSTLLKIIYELPVLLKGSK